MKCSRCYTTNSPWATVCTSCGQPVQRLEICPLGHLLPPGAAECPVCPGMWPEVPAFAGPPLLRGVLLVEAGHLYDSSNPARELAYLEVRDREDPQALKVQASGVVHLVADDDSNADCRLLMRPLGPQLCIKTGSKPRAGTIAYEALAPGAAFDLGRTSFRYLVVRPPTWVETMVESSLRQP